jgi:ABC-type multidrug transport system permease subunit
MVCELPSKVACAFIFNLPLYFMTGLKREAGAFFTFFLFAFCCTICMSMIFRTIASMSRTLSQAMAPLAVFILLLIIYTGFILPIRSMQNWLRWLNYLNPVAYAFEALMANEFHGRKVPCAQFIPSGPDYQNATGFQRSCSVGGGLPGSDTVDGDTYINANFEYYHSHLWR